MPQDSPLESNAQIGPTRRAVLGRVGAVFGGALALAGCGITGPGGQADSSGAAQSAPQRVEVWSPFPDTHITTRPMWEGFLKQHPGWTSELTVNVSWEKFQTSLAGGTVPDAYWSNFNVIPVAAHKGMFLALDPFISRDKVDMNQYFSNSTMGALYKGKVYGMPRHSNVRSVYVNQRLLREVGMDPNKAPAGWEDFLQVNQRVKRADGQGMPDRIGFHPVWHLDIPPPLAYLQANGVPLVSADGDKVAFATPAGIEAFKWVADSLAALGGQAALAEYEKRFQQGVGEALGKNAAAMMLAGVWRMARDTFVVEPTSQIAQWPMPGGPSAKGKTFGYFAGTSGVLPASAQRRDAGWTFVRWQASEAGQRFVQEVPGSWDQACIGKVANDAKILQEQPWRKRANELLSQARSYAYFPHAGSNEVTRVMNAAFAPLIAGRQGPDATMQEVRQQVQNAMDEFR
jgi:multiple sugar transport system substrate-binding protein